MPLKEGDSVQFGLDSKGTVKVRTQSTPEHACYLEDRALLRTAQNSWQLESRALGYLTVEELLGACVEATAHGVEV